MSGHGQCARYATVKMLEGIRRAPKTATNEETDG